MVGFRNVAAHAYQQLDLGVVCAVVATGLGDLLHFGSLALALAWPALPLQRRPLAVIEPGEGIWHEAKEHRSGVAVATSRGRDAGIVSKTEPGKASVQVISAVSRPRATSE